MHGFGLFTAAGAPIHFASHLAFEAHGFPQNGTPYAAPVMVQPKEHRGYKGVADLFLFDDSLFAALEPASPLHYVRLHNRNTVTIQDVISATHALSFPNASLILLAISCHMVITMGSNAGCLWLAISSDSAPPSRVPISVK